DRPLGSGAEDLVVAPVGAEGDRSPSDLALLALVDASAEDLGDELRPEADPEHRSSGLDRPFDQVGLDLEEGVAVHLVGRHRPTEDDETADRSEVARWWLSP